MAQHIRNIGILAHADAGKTTITENFLFLGGLTKSVGSVDKGTTQTDFLEVERDRGISVRSSLTTFHWKNTQINLVDTPGHVDFSADVERVLRVLDGAVLVISAVEGVQAHTGTIWSALRERGLPVLIFINKIDRAGADVEAVLKEIKKELSSSLVVLQEIQNEGDNNATILSCWDESHIPEDLTESIAGSSEELLDKYLEGREISFTELDETLVRAVHQSLLTPVLFGSAKNETGTTELLEAIVRYLPPPSGDSSKPLSALVYGIGHDNTMGKVAHVRVFDGSISNREIIRNSTLEIEEKVTQVRRLLSGKSEDTGIVSAGDIAGICGMNNARIGDIIGGNGLSIPKHVSLRTPLFTVQVRAQNEKEYPALAAALQELALEDPSLQFEWLREDRELHMNLMGWMQMEVLEQIIEKRFRLLAKFGTPTVIYKETPSTSGEGFVQYWMPKPCWAIMKFRIEPGERGSGVVYNSAVGVNSIRQKYQNEAERTIPLALQQGIKGWEVTDIKITLIEGEDHEMHSRPGDFAIATPMGIMNGLVNTGTTLLEPIISYRIVAPETLLGIITSDITQLRGSFESPVMDNGKFILTGLLPASTSLDFPVKLSSRSGGNARISTKFHGYEACTDEQGVIRPFKGISPLDTAKYILKARKALQ